MVLELLDIHLERLECISISPAYTTVVYKHDCGHAEFDRVGASMGLIEFFVVFGSRMFGEKRRKSMDDGLMHRIPLKSLQISGKLFIVLLQCQHSPPLMSMSNDQDGHERAQGSS